MNKIMTERDIRRARKTPLKPISVRISVDVELKRDLERASAQHDIPQANIIREGARRRIAQLDAQSA